MKCDLECDFHDSDKMPKRVAMVWTKCQPKSWDGQNANQRDKSGQNANLWLALCPVGILSGWHFVRTPCVTLRTPLHPVHYGASHDVFDTVMTPHIL